MSRAHNHSRLILEGQVPSLPFNSVHFNFNKDVTGIQRGEIIEPVYAISPHTMKWVDGRFGGGVAIDEATTNMITTNVFQGSTAGAVAPTTSWGTANGSGIYAADLPRDIDSGLSLRLTSNAGSSGNGTYFDSNSGISIVDGQSYTMSYYAKSIKEEDVDGKLFTLNRLSDNAYFGSPPTVRVTKEWKRYFHTFTANSATSGACRIRNIIYNPNSIWVTGFQLENKGFPTSFTKTSRGNGRLAMTDSVILPESGTVSLWYCPYFPPELNINQTTSPIILQVGSYYANSSFTLWNYSKYFNVYVKGPTSSGWSGSGSYGPGVFPQFVWKMVTVTWNNTSWRMYIDGKFVTSFTATETLGAFAGGVVSLGGDPAGLNAKPANGIFDEFIVLDVAASDDEIESWYVSGAPFYNQFDTRAYAL